MKEKESLEQQIVQYQRELQRVNDATAETERNVVRLAKENLALGLNTSKAEKEVLTLRKSVKQLEESSKEASQLVGTPSETKLVATITKLNGDLARAKAEKPSQQDMFSRRIEDMPKKKDEELSEYSAQVRTLHAELLRMQGYRERSPENIPSKESVTPNPKREVAVADAQNTTYSNPRKFQWPRRVDRCHRALLKSSSLPFSEWSKESPALLIGPTSRMRGPLVAVLVANIL